MCRFKLGSEQSISKGFRRANVNWSPFKDDFEVNRLKDKQKRKEFMDILRPFLTKKYQLVLIGRQLMFLVMRIVNSIAMGCPFDHSEKQALLEAKDIDDRIEILLSLMKMSINENKNIASGAIPS